MNKIKQIEQLIKNHKKTNLKTDSKPKGIEREKHVSNMFSNAWNRRMLFSDAYCSVAYIVDTQKICEG